MMLALLLGIRDAGERAEEALARVDGRRARMPSASRNSALDLGRARSSRIRPWSTKMQCSWSPIARCTSAAATDESTPPESPQTACPSPTCCADRRDRLVDERRPSSRSAGSRRCRARSCSSSSPPPSVWTTSGWNWMPQSGRSRMAHGGERRVVARSRCSAKPSGSAQHAIAVAHPDGALARRSTSPSKSGSLALELQRARPYSRSSADSTRRRAAGTRQLEPVADAEHRHAELEHAAVRDVGASASSTLDGPPDRMMPRRRERAHDVESTSAGMDLAVDAALAHAARDQLRDTASRSRGSGSSSSSPGCSIGLILGIGAGVLSMSTRGGSSELPS